MNLTKTENSSRPPCSRAAELIAALGLERHPEGGWFREIHRSPDLVQPSDGRGPRAALTIIYFLLAEGEVSRWHQVRSDEAWCWLEGAPLELLHADDDFARVETRTLGPHGPRAEPVHVVPAGAWQAARSLGSYTLVSCAVGPGFDFADFAMLRDRPDTAARLTRAQPELAGLV